MAEPGSDFKPLAGVRVLDFSHVIAGPLASFYLAQMGAEVTKVESHAGDVMRRNPRGMAAFVALNAGKRCITLDLADPAGQAQALALARDADVLVESLRPGTLDRHGLGPEALAALNPRLIYCAISGYGASGPWQGRPAYDHVIQAATGMMMMAGREGDDPIKTGFPVIDAATATMAAFAIVSALRERDLGGPDARGRFIDCSMTGAAMQLMYPFACAALSQGVSPPRVGNQGYSGSPAADIFEARDGWIAIGANTPRQFQALLGAIGQPEIAADTECFDAPPDSDAPVEFLRAKDPARLRERLSAALRQHDAGALEAACNAVGVPAARVRQIGEFATEAKAAGALPVRVLSDQGVQLLSPGLGFQVR